VSSPADTGHLVLIDQTRLPGEVMELRCRTVQEVWQAIRQLSVRGAPAIGVAAAYGVCLAPHDPQYQEMDPIASVHAACDYLATSRPTAVNLFWALDRMREVAAQTGAGGLDAAFALPADRPALCRALIDEAQRIAQLDRETCAAIGRHGADLLVDLPVGAGILTHCNAGALATAGDGTALAVVYELARRGKRPHVWVDETRPLLQGARLTTWELMQRGIDCTLICDSMAPLVLRDGRVGAVVTGADRIAANGDVANKVGTYGLAVQADVHGVPFYVAAPHTTFDLHLPEGSQIPIEMRPDAEITAGMGTMTAPAGVACLNPAFDVTPARLIRGLITDRGAITTLDQGTIAATIAAERG
jgi:methylthioribose-1-phosphate isomerase